MHLTKYISRPGLGLGRLLTVYLLAWSRFTYALKLDPNSTDSIKSVSKQIAADMMEFYIGDQPGQIPGLLPEPYYWWYAGAMFGSLVDYWYYTGDDQYVDVVRQALVFQVGDYDDYMPRNQTRTEGNDDQGFWALTVMSAAEYNFPHPKPEEPQYLALAQAVFNTQAARWDNENCGGGLRWQIFQWNGGYNYKNSISQACFFALGARLALFTGNSSYADWAETTWDWMWDIDLINHETWGVYDGGHVEDGCKKKVPYQWSYNAGGMILGAAAMYNYTESDVWKDRLDGLLKGISVFFKPAESDPKGSPGTIMSEVACEPVRLCNLDQTSFKAYLTRWLAVTTQWAPHTADLIIPLLKTSAVAATSKCTAGANGRMCSLFWLEDEFSGNITVGQQMAALEITLSCMIESRPAPLTGDNGGTSKGDPSAGSEDIGRTEPQRDWKKITSGDKAGAAILTALVLGMLIAGMIWMFTDETSDKDVIHQFRGFTAATVATFGAVAAGGGVAALLDHQREKPINEKSGAVLQVGSNTSVGENGNKTGASAASPVFVGTTHNTTSGHQRRASNMPIGWPHNRSMRASTLVDPDSIQPVSGRFSRDWTGSGPEASNASFPGSPSTPVVADSPSTPKSSAPAHTHTHNGSTSRFVEEIDDGPTRNPEEHAIGGGLGQGAVDATNVSSTKTNDKTNGHGSIGVAQ